MRHLQVSSVSLLFPPIPFPINKANNINEGCGLGGCTGLVGQRIEAPASQSDKMIKITALIKHPQNRIRKPNTAEPLSLLGNWEPCSIILNLLDGLSRGGGKGSNRLGEAGRARGECRGPGKEHEAEEEHKQRDLFT